MPSLRYVPPNQGVKRESGTLALLQMLGNYVKKRAPECQCISLVTSARARPVATGDPRLADLAQMAVHRSLVI